MVIIFGVIHPNFLLFIFIIYIYFVQFVCNSFLFCFNLHSNTNLWFIKLYTLFTKLITKGKIQVIYRVILNYVIPSNNFLLDWYFKNSIVGLYVYYVLSTHIKFRANQMLFIIWSKNPYFMHNFKYKNMKFKHLIDDMVIDFRSSYNFARM